MEYKRFGNKIIVRIDKDEEILEQVKELALKENIRLAVGNLMQRHGEQRRDGHHHQHVPHHAPRVHFHHGAQ